MTLRELIAAHPAMFYRQSWFEGEAFVEREATDLPMPSGVATSDSGLLAVASAATLAALYVRDPSHPCWKRYLWTTDLDRYGQRVYVGDNGLGFEIHRHIHLTERFGVPVWA